MKWHAGRDGLELTTRKRAELTASENGGILSSPRRATGVSDKRLPLVLLHGQHRQASWDAWDVNKLCYLTFVI